jgi:PQQ-like domain
MRRLARALLAAGRGGWRAAATLLRIAPAVFAALAIFLLACRALHFARPSLPGSLDDRVGQVMALGFSFALNQGASVILLAQLAAAIVALLLVGRLVAWLRRRPRPGLRLLPLPRWIVALVWLGLALGNPLLDFQPALLGLLVCTAPVLLWAGRARGAPLRILAVAALAAAFAVWLALGTAPDRFDLIYGGAWLVCCLLALAVRPWFARVTDWATAVVVAYAVLQGSTLVYDRLPVFAPDPDARIIAEGNVFHWCENTERGLLYATHTSCAVWSMPRCRDDFIAVHDLRDPRRVQRLQFFDDTFSGRMMHLLCLPDRVQVGMGATFINGRLRAGNVMEFAVDDPTRVTRDVLGDASDDGTGAIFLFDRARGAVFYVSESRNRVLRVDLATGAQRWIELRSIRSWPPPHWSGRFILSLPAPTSTGPDATFAPRATGFFVEWMRGSKVVELDLARGEEVGTYATNNGGNQSVAVDEGRERLLVTGVWGLEAFDLRSGRRIARLRTPFGPRLPVIDAAHDLVFVPTTFGNHILVLDRDTLDLVGRLAVGTGGRFAHLTADGSRLFASGGRRTYMWDTATLARRFGRARRDSPA